MQHPLHRLLHGRSAAGIGRITEHLEQAFADDLLSLHTHDLQKAAAGFSAAAPGS